jgi:hypothetical protein
VHQRQQEGTHVAAEEDPVEEIPVELHHLVLTVFELGEPLVLLRADIEVAAHAGRPLRCESLQVDAGGAGHADVGVGAAGEGRQLHPARDDADARLIEREDGGEELVLDRRPDHGARLFDEGLRVAVADAEVGQKAAALEFAALVELEGVAVVESDIQIQP